MKVHATFDGEPYDGSIVNPDRETAGGQGSGDGQGTGMRQEEWKMWTCPKCGRTFKKREQDHYCGKAPVPAGLILDIARWCHETGNHP